MAKLDAVKCRDCLHARVYVRAGGRCEWFKPKEQPDMTNDERAGMVNALDALQNHTCVGHHEVVRDATIVLRKCISQLEDTLRHYKDKETPDMSTSDGVEQALQVLSSVSVGVKDNIGMAQNAMRVVRKHIAHLDATLARRQAHIDDLQRVISMRNETLRDRDKANNTRPDGGDITAAVLEERVAGLGARVAGVEVELERLEEDAAGMYTRMRASDVWVGRHIAHHSKADS